MNGSTEIYKNLTTHFSELTIDRRNLAALLREGADNARRYAGEVVVVKLGGTNLEGDATQWSSLPVFADISRLRALNVHMVVVHGGGKAIDQALKDANINTKRVAGIRITPPEAVSIINETLTTKITTPIVNLFGKEGQGIRGSEILKATRDEKFGAVGFEPKLELKGLELIDRAISAKQIPVISCTARDPRGVLNCNADDVATAIAIGLKAKKLIFVSNVSGLLSDPQDALSLIPVLERADIQNLKDSGVISGGMLPKVSSAVRAIEQGVGTVCFIGIDSLLAELAINEGQGTEIR